MTSSQLGETKPQDNVTMAGTLVSRRNRPAKPQGGSRPASTAGLLAGHAQSAWQFTTDKSSMYRMRVAQRLVGNRWSLTLTRESGAGRL